MEQTRIVTAVELSGCADTGESEAVIPELIGCYPIVCHLGFHCSQLYARVVKMSRYSGNRHFLFA
jgi:hypothetical protein